MSLILDALRKSEAERRRGLAPDLFTSPSAPARQRRVRPLRLWPWLVMVVLVLGAGFVLWTRREQATPAVLETGQGEAGTHGTTMAAIETTPAADAPPDTPANAATSAASAPKPPGNLANDAPNPLTANPPRATVQPLPAASDLAPAMPALPAPAPTDDSDSESLPSIAVLSASERASLPPLKLSMHVWNSEPGKRFAIIDGQRVTEGSTVGACIIEQIRRDGVVLNISGRRVLLPRP